jgi:Protein of unknown function (DUF2384)
MARRTGYRVAMPNFSAWRLDPRCRLPLRPLRRLNAPLGWRPGRTCGGGGQSLASTASGTAISSFLSAVSTVSRSTFAWATSSASTGSRCGSAVSSHARVWPRVTGRSRRADARLALGAYLAYPAYMAARLVVERVAVGSRGIRRLPKNLPWDIPGREQLEQALQNAGLAIVAIEKVEEAPSSADPGSADKARLRAELEALVNDADESERARLEAAVTASPDGGLDERFWGPAPDSVTAAEAVVADLADQFAQRRELAANSISREAAAKLLAISPQSITDKLESRKLVGIKVGREWRLPRWQFDPDNTTGALTDLDVLQAAFPGGPVSLSRWIMRPNPEFGGRTPRDEVIAHGSASVIKVARALTAAGW